MILIDKAALLNTIATEVHYDSERPLEMYAKLLSVVNDAPTVDAVEVVRCEECESWGLNAIKKDEKGEVIYGDCLHFCVATPKRFYCAWGERKEDAETD